MRANREIRAKEVRLIGRDGKQIGIVAIFEAQRLAQEEGLDLVEISPNASPPVCKIVDYDKLRYEMTKKEKESRQHQQNSLKEVKVKPNIDEGDLKVKIAKMAELIEKGHKVRLTCMFRGREMVYQEIGHQVVQKMIDGVGDLAHVESPPKQMGRNYSLVLAPSVKKNEKSNGVKVKDVTGGETP